MPISIYPPILKSTQPAFLYTASSYEIEFTLQQTSSFDEIGHIQIRIVKQSNNRTIVNTALYPDGTIYKTPAEIKTSGQEYSISIIRNDLSESWQPGFLYKIQMRFGTTPKYTSISDFATWKKQQIDNQTFSEWSTVMVIKAISAPTIYIKNAEAVRQDTISTERTETTLTPLFVGSCMLEEINKEAVDKYKFNLYEGKEVEQQSLIESSGWIQHDSNVNSVDVYRFHHILSNNENYTVTYETITVNGYESSASPYSFLASRAYYAQLKDIELYVDDKDEFCRENGCLRIYLNANSPLSGAFVLTRSDEHSNYEVWEDLQFFILNKEDFHNRWLYDDFTIESGIKYKYAIQQENAAGLRTSPVYDPTNAFHYIDFEHVYLYHDGVQLKLSLNNNISTFKHSVLASKQDTLGDRFPHVVKNGYAYYAEFPITGLITFQMDRDQTFFSIGDKGFYYNGELAIPRDKLREFDMIRGECSPYVGEGETGVITDYNHLTIDSNLTDNNIFVERKFREKAEEFLNNYDYKLFKSPTEGNIVVVLTNVSMTPNQALGRIIYEFSATVYEVMENNLHNLDEFGIINIGKFQTLASDEIHLSFGQISGIYTSSSVSNNDVYAQIKAQEEISLGGGYKTRLERVRSFWVERYPKASFVAELTELKALRAQLEKKGEPTTEVDAKIEEYNNLSKALSTAQKVNTILNINGRNIIIMPNRMYSVREPIYNLTVVSSTYPIIINYICELTQQEDLSVGVVSAVDASRVWGQISGIFTGTDKILKTYNYNYGPNKTPLRVYNGRPDKTIIYDSMGNIVVDNTNFNVYKTINLLDIIKEETRKQIEIIYNITGGFKLDDQGRWTDGIIYYNFSDIIYFDIEVDYGTIIYVGKKEDGSDKIPIKIGPTQRYVLNPMDALVNFVALSEPKFAIVNYKCLTTQTKMLKRG